MDINLPMLTVILLLTKIYNNIKIIIIKNSAKTLQDLASTVLCEYGFISCIEFGVGDSSTLDP